jgi:hypothetical protein
MEANMGGTKILPALKFVLENPVEEKYPRQVFLLTDGGDKNILIIISFLYIIITNLIFNNFISLLTYIIVFY